MIILVQRIGITNPPAVARTPGRMVCMICNGERYRHKYKVWQYKTSWNLRRFLSNIINPKEQKRASWQPRSLRPVEAVDDPIVKEEWFDHRIFFDWRIGPSQVPTRRHRNSPCREGKLRIHHLANERI